MHFPKVRIINDWCLCIFITTYKGIIFIRLLFNARYATVISIFWNGFSFKNLIITSNMLNFYYSIAIFDNFLELFLLLIDLTIIIFVNLIFVFIEEILILIIPISIFYFLIIFICILWNFFIFFLFLIIIIKFF